MPRTKNYNYIFFLIVDLIGFDVKAIVKYIERPWPQTLSKITEFTSCYLNFAFFDHYFTFILRELEIIHPNYRTHV